MSSAGLLTDGLDADRCVTTEAHRTVINSVRTHVAAVLVGTCFIFFYVIMPVTLGNAADSRGLDDRALGFIASSFMLGVFFVIILARLCRIRLLLHSSADYWLSLTRASAVSLVKFEAIPLT